MQQCKVKKCICFVPLSYGTVAIGALIPLINIASLWIAETSPDIQFNQPIWLNLIVTVFWLLVMASLLVGVYKKLIWLLLVGAGCLGFQTVMSIVSLFIGIYVVKEIHVIFYITITVVHVVLHLYWVLIIWSYTRELKEQAS